jgi:signal peptidase I
MYEHDERRDWNLDEKKNIKTMNMIFCIFFWNFIYLFIYLFIFFFTVVSTSTQIMFEGKC